MNDATAASAYSQRLTRLESVWWKRWLNVQAPYQWNLRRLRLGRTLDVGCGLGRNLVSLDGVGIDHNPESVGIARSRGLRAFTPEQFERSAFARPGAFDSLLLSHVMEHLGETEGDRLLSQYLPYLRPGGRVAFITPQELGYRSDSTHVRFVGFEELCQSSQRFGLTVERSYSFPFPRFAGRVFKYNEFVLIARRRA